MKRVAILLICCLFSLPGYTQRLQQGFDKAEYIELLKISARQGDKENPKNVPAPTRSKKLYRSEITGMDNRWDLYLRDDNVAVISIRGTTSNTISWVENLYSAMVPAQGEITLTDNYKLNYHLADDEKAGVHIGWLIGMGFLAADILPKIDSCYKAGVKDYLIMGHSQGGAIAFLLTSHLYNLRKTGKLPADIHFKTYSSAGPKPGNLYYAYDYEAMTEGWAFNVVNAADWVPETPVSVQTVKDFNKVSPTADADRTIGKQKFPKNIVLRHVYKRMSKPGLKAQKRYRKYLGNMIAGTVHKHIKQYKPPKYLKTTHYVRTGRTIVLMPDEDYYKQFPDSKENIFVHHTIRPYLFLTNKLRSDLK
jgi:hypothetical protein